MSTATSLNKCINIHAEEFKGRIPEHILQLANKNRKVKMVAALEEHIDTLVKSRKPITKQHKENVGDYLQQGINASAARAYTNNPEDVNNELNTFSTKSLKKLFKNLVQRHGNVGKALTSKNLIKNGVSPEEAAVYEDFQKNFNQRFGQSIESIFNIKENRFYRFEDMVQYLPKRDEDDLNKVLGVTYDGTDKTTKLDPMVKAAIGATAYEWLHTEGHRALRQTDQSLRTLFDIEKEETISANAYNLLKGLGVNSEDLAKQLGRTILDRMSIEPTKDSDFQAGERLELSLGFLAIGAMEYQGLLQRQELYSGFLSDTEILRREKEAAEAIKLKKKPPVYEINDGEFGLEGLKNGHGLEKYQVFYDPKGDTTREGTGTIKFMKLDSKARNKYNKKYPATPEKMRHAEELMKAAPNAFHKLFDSTPDERNFSFKKFTYPKRMRIGRTNDLSSKEQARNLEKYSNIPIEPSRTTMDVFDLLDKPARDRIIGHQTDEFKLDIRKDNIEGVNLGLLREYENLLAWQEQSEKLFETVFYIGNKFQSNHRMNQTGDINPQNSKMHRNLFSPSSWKTAFATTPNNAFINKTGIERSFLEAIALSFGIESGKVGGVDKQLNLLEDLLTNPKNDDYQAIASAISYLREHATQNRKAEIPSEMQSIIADGVEVGGEKTHSLKGLIEYARYLNHVDNESPSKGDFTTDMYKEVDGVSNGPIIGILQLIPDSADKQAVLASLAMGGMSINPLDPITGESVVNLDELLAKYNLNDAYQRMAHQWALNVEVQKENWRVDDDWKAEQNYNNAVALEQILGKFTDKDGVVNKIIRDLAKPRTMQTIYSAGMAKQKEIFTVANVINDGIYGSIEKVIKMISDNKAKEVVEAEFSRVMKATATLSQNEEYTDIDNFRDPAGNLDIGKIKKFKLSNEEIESINKATTFTYGLAMAEAVDEVYGSIIKAKKPFNTLIQRSVTIYNMVLKQKVEAALANNTSSEKKDVGRLTIAQLDEILASIDHLVPRVKTPFYKKGDESYITLAVPGKQKIDGKTVRDSSATSKVTQQYVTGTISKNKGHVASIPYLKDPGASAMVRLIQMIDATVANNLMSKDQDVVNAHDGFPHGIADSGAVAETTNNKFFDVADNYSIGAAIIEMHNKMEKELLASRLESKLTTNELIERYKQDRVITTDLIGYAFGYNESDIKTEIKSIKEKKKITHEQATDIFINNNIPYENVQSDKRTKAMMVKRAEFFKKMDKHITDRANTMAEQVTNNKRTVVDALTHVAQYPNGGVGVNVNENLSSPERVFGLIPDRITLTDERNTDYTASSIKNLIDSGYGSSNISNVSVQVGDYPAPGKIDSKNVTEQFEATVQLDVKEKHTSVQDSPEHIKYLTGVMNDIVKKIMSPVEVFMAFHKTNKETAGRYTIDEKTGNRIWIQRQPQPGPGMLSQQIRMSAAEVYSHEMIHHIMYAGLRGSTHIRHQAYNLHDLAQKAFIGQYGDNAFRVFMNDPNADITDPANKFEVAAAKERWEYIFEAETEKDGTHKGIDEFLTFGMTNENFRRELGKLVIPDRTIKAHKALNGIFEKNIQTTIVNLFSRIMDIIGQTVFKQKHAKRADLEVTNLVVALAQVQAHQKTAIYKAAVGLENKAVAISVDVDEKIKNVAVKTMNKTQLGRVISKTKQLPELNNILSHKMRLVLNWYEDSEQGLIASIVTEMKGTTERLKPLHNLLARRNRAIDAAANEAAAIMREVNNTWFDRELNSDEKTAITKAGLKTDLSDLMTKTSPRAVVGFLEDQSLREAKIQSLLTEIMIDPALKKHKDFFEKAADDLGYYMVTTDGRPGGVPMMNASNIAKMSMTPNFDTLDDAAYKKAVDIIDQLSSLSALRYVSNDHKNSLVNLMHENIQSIENVFTNHNLLKEQALRDSFNGNPHLMQKGYTKQILNSRIEYTQGVLADKEKFEYKGWKMQATPIKRDPSDPIQEDIYMFKSTLGTVNDLQSGIASNVRNKAAGTSQYDLQKQIGNTVNAYAAAAADINNKAVLASTRETLKKMALPGARNFTRAGATNMLVPKFDTDGKMTQMRYVMSEHTKDNVLQQFSEFDAILASMASQIVSKKTTPIINSDLVIALKDLHDHKEYGFKQVPESFVEISPFSKNERYRDIYQMLPPKTKIQIESTWGGNRMLVPIDVVDLAFGQRKYSIVEMFGKDPKTQGTFVSIMNEVATFALGWQNPFAKETEGTDSAKRYRVINRAKAIEDFMVQLTKLGKSNIIVRSFFVSYGNYASNLMYLKSKGMTLENIRILSSEAITSSLKYQRDNSNLKLIQSQREVINRNTTMTANRKSVQLTNIDRKIKRLLNEIALNPSTPMIEAGLMPAIVDDVDTGSLQSPYKHGLDAGIDIVLGKLPGKVEKGARTLFMTEETEGFKMLNNAVKMTDYVGRYALYHHYTKEKGMNHQDALSAVNDEFINFALPTHRMIEHLNNIGLVWFSKYQLRVLKHIKNLVKEHPFTTLSTFILGAYIGDNNILNSIPGFTKDALQGFGNPMSMFADSINDILYVNGVETAASTLMD
ncbi:MAG: hypothetical protein DRH26_01095 [Deltaproteobacteria bacterium]|nr:MAG: hypothetical protein DRH26_01095 [Deltaproteobacteria bacterium]